VFPLIDNSLAPHVAVNMVPPAAGTDAFNQDDEGRQWPAGVPLTPLGEEVLIGQLNNLYTGFGSNFGNNNL